MSNTYGENIKLTIFGQSHSEAIGMVLEGIPAGLDINETELMRFMERRAPGRNSYSTPRFEADRPEFLGGIKDGRTCGGPISAIIRNTNTRPSDYAKLKNIPRPGHADYTAFVKYGGKADMSGGGQFSGRMTAAMCIAGGICKQLLESKHISIISRICAIGGIEDEGELAEDISGKAFPTVSDTAGQMMQEAILKAKAEGDSLGGIIECAVLGLEAGIGGPLFGGMESRIASIVFGIPAVKGIEFGAGFGAAKIRGSENNDPFYYDNGIVRTRTNNAGGILGGITDGMPLTFRTAFKPTPSIAKQQESIDLETRTGATLKIEGRHDPCIVPRALACVEAAAAIAVYDALAGEANDRK